MRVTCPACAATYDVPDRMIGAGRRLRCAKCGQEWRVAPEAPAAGPARQPAAPSPPPAGAAAPRDMPPPTPARRRPPQVIEPPLPRPDDAPSPRRDRLLWLAWALTGLALLALAVALYLFRAEIVAAWPPAERLYLALGLEV